MADIKPFCSIRPGKGLEANVAALPYDVYNRQEAKEAVKGNPLSFLNIDRAETGLADEVDTYDPKVYERAQQLLTGQIADGSFVFFHGSNGSNKSIGSFSSNTSSARQMRSALILPLSFS